MSKHISKTSLTEDAEIILERPRVDALLEKAVENSTVFVIAGEGYGKTCAVHSFLRRKNKTPIWISLSERDNNPLHLWETVVRAVGSHDSNAGKILEEIGFPESTGQISRCLSIFSDAISDSKNYVVVADDCHLIHEEAIFSFTNRILAFPFPKLTTILISRAELKLNTMALLSKGLLSRIGADDLRFTGEETAAYFRLRDIHLSEDEAKGISVDTEGWILAISIIADEMKNGNRKYDRSLLENGNIRLMKEALFASVPIPLRRFLVVLSLFEQWPLEAVEKISGQKR